MEDNIHPVVRLLAKRMESHPEEFRFHDSQTLAITGRWETWVHQIRPFLNEAEDEMLFGKAKEAFLQRVHEEVLDELLNGDERRAKENRQREEAEQAYVQQQRAYLQQAAQPGSFVELNNVNWGRQNNLFRGASQLGGANGYPYYDSITDTYEFGNGMKMTKAQIENNPGLINSLKKALGL